MAANDIKILKSPGPVREYHVSNRDASELTATIKPGEPVKESESYVTLLATADPEIGTDVFVGIAIKESTEVAATDGVVRVVSLLRDTVLRGKAHTADNINTAAKLLAFINNSVTFDYTDPNFTIHENETDDPNVHGLIILDGDIVKGTLDVLVNVLATQSSAGFVGQTIE